MRGGVNVAEKKFSRVGLGLLSALAWWFPAKSPSWIKALVLVVGVLLFAQTVAELFYLNMVVEADKQFLQDACGDILIKYPMHMSEKCRKAYENIHMPLLTQLWIVRGVREAFTDAIFSLAMGKLLSLFASPLWKRFADYASNTT